MEYTPGVQRLVDAYGNYFKTAKPDSVTPWADGTLKMGASNDVATYKDPEGKEWYLNRDPDVNQLQGFYKQPGVKAQWDKEFGSGSPLFDQPYQMAGQTNSGQPGNTPGMTVDPIETPTNKGLLSTTPSSTPTLSEVAPAGSPAVTSPAPAPAPAAVTPEALPGSTLATAPSAYVAPEYTPGEDATVEGRLKGLLSTGSPYLDAARARAAGVANSRGLLNSSMAATAGEKAAIESALPIAQQDATTFANAGMTGYQGEITAAQSVQQAGQTQELAKLQAGLTAEVGAAQAKLDAALKSGLSSQEAMQTTLLASHQAALQAGLNEQDALLKSSLATLQAGLTAGLSEQESKQRVYEAAQVALSQSKLNAQEQAAAMERLAAELESKGGLLGKQLEADKEIAQMQQEGANLRAQAENALTAAKLDKETYDNAQGRMAAFSDSYTNQLIALQSDPNLAPESRTAVMEELRTQYIFNMDMVGQLAGIKIEWSVPEIPNTPSSPKPA